MKQTSYLLSTTPPQQTVGIARRITPFHRFRRKFPCENHLQKSTGKELDRETGLYYFGARYLDPRTSRWLSVDPAIWQGDFLPSAPINDEARERNENLPGMGGVFNTVNLHVFAYGGNNPIRYVDPDGRAIWKAAAVPVVVAYKSIKAGSLSVGIKNTIALGARLFTRVAPIVPVTQQIIKRFNANDLVLGLNKSGSLQKWAQEFGGKTFGKFETLSRSFSGQIRDAMKQATNIRVNLDGIDLRKISGKLNQFGEPIMGYTNYELFVLKNTPEFLQKATFYLNNVQVPSPF